VILLALCVTFSDVKVAKFEPDASRHTGSKSSTCRSGMPIVWLQFFYKSCLLLAHIFNRKTRLRVRQRRKCGWNSSRDKRSSPKRPDRRRSSPNLLFNRYRRSRGRGMELTIHLRLLLRLRMSGSMPPLLHVPSWRRHGQIYCPQKGVFPVNALASGDSSLLEYDTVPIGK